MLEEGKNNYIGGVYADSRALGLCLCDISTGEFYVTSFPAGAEAMDHLKNELGPVSYTHLDVYKRQAISPFRSPMTEARPGRH